VHESYANTWSGLEPPVSASSTSSSSSNGLPAIPTPPPPPAGAQLSQGSPNPGHVASSLPKFMHSGSSPVMGSTGSLPQRFPPVSSAATPFRIAMLSNRGSVPPPSSSPGSSVQSQQLQSQVSGSTVPFTYGFPAPLTGRPGGRGNSSPGGVWRPHSCPIALSDIQQELTNSSLVISRTTNRKFSRVKKVFFFLR
jgi:hypothetical protein